MLFSRKRNHKHRISYKIYRQKYALFFAIFFNSFCLAEENNSYDLESNQVYSQIKRLAENGEKNGAISLAKTFLDKTVKRFGESAPNTAKALLQLSDVYIAGGYYVNAKSSMKEACSLYETISQLESQDLLNCIDRMAALDSDYGQHEQAIEQYQHALRIREKLGNDNTLEAAETLNGLGLSLMHLGKYKQALPIHQKALDIRQKKLGSADAVVAQSIGNLATTYLLLGDYKSAIPLQERSVEIREKILGSDDPKLVVALNNLATAYSKIGELEKALQINARVLKISEAQFGPESLEAALSLNNLASTFFLAGDYKKALPLAERAATVQQQILGLSDLGVVDSLNTLAQIYSQQGNFEKAGFYLKKKLSIQEKNLDPYHPEISITLSNLAQNYSDLSQYDNALPFAIRALAISEKNLDPNHPDIATALTKLGRIYAEVGKIENAVSILTRAVSIRETSLGREHSSTAASIYFLASCYEKMGKYEDSLSLFQRALSILEKTAGSEHPDTLVAARSLAENLMLIGEYDSAASLAESTAAITERIYGGNSQRTANTLELLGNIYLKLGDFDKSCSLFSRSLNILQNSVGAVHADTATAFSDLGLCELERGQNRKAILLLRHAIDLRKRIFGEYHENTASSIDALALAYGRVGRREAAISFEKRALLSREKSLGENHPDVAISLNNLGGLYFDSGRPKKALPELQRALMISEEFFGSKHPNTAIILSNLAKAHLASGNLEDDLVAILFLKEAVNAYQVTRERVSHIGEKELRLFTASIESPYQRLAELLTDYGRLAEAQRVLDMLKETEQFDFIRRDAAVDPRSSRIGYTQTEESWIVRYNEIADQLAALGKEERDLDIQAKLGLTEEQKKRQLSLQADLHTARAAFDKALTDMREDFSRKGPARTVEVEETSRTALANLQALIKSLGTDVVLLQAYIVDDGVNFLLTTPDIQIARHTTISKTELNRQIGSFRGLLSGDPAADPLPMAQSLYKLLLAPIEQDLIQSAAKTVMLSLDGSLRYLPFGALHDGQRYAVQRWNMPLYNSVVRDRLRDGVNPQWQVAGLGVTRQLGDFPALPGVQAELDSVVQSRSGGILPGEVYLDDAFTAARLKDVSNRTFPVLHIASHFQFSPGTEINSFLLLGDGSELTLGDIRTQNYRFDNVDLLTLSACNTGLGGGRDATGKEIDGFGVIAQQQGAKAVMATLWPVRDQSTALLMADMYREHQHGGVSKIEALRRAQLALLKQPKYASPHYWAPFILMGNWK